MVYLNTKNRPDILQLDFAVVSTSPIKTRVKWVLTPQPDTEEVFKAVSYNLYFNQVPNRYLVKLNDTPITETRFVHNTAKYTKFPRGYYQIEAIDEKGNSLKSSVHDLYVPFDNLSYKESQEFLFACMRRRDERIDFMPALIYARKGFGSEKCPKCNVNGLGALKSKCPTCLGTGFTGGFHFPVLTFLNYGEAFSKSRSDQGNRRAEEVTSTIFHPAEVCMIDIGDYIRELQTPHRLFCVTNIGQDEYSGRPLALRVSVQLEESGHPLWDIDMPTMEIPDQIFYRSCREAYERIVDSFNQGPEGSLGEFPQYSPPQVTREADGTVRYRGYP